MQQSTAQVTTQQNINAAPVATENVAVAWHISAQAWLLQDGQNITDDVEQAGRFTSAQITELKKQHDGERFSLVAPKFWSDVQLEKQIGLGAPKLEIIRDEFVLWGNGNLSAGNYLHIDRAATQADGENIPFALPENAQMYQRRVSWAWRYNTGTDSAWQLADTETEALGAAKEFALANMRSTWYHSCHLWFAFKNQVTVMDMTKEAELA